MTHHYSKLLRTISSFNQLQKVLTRPNFMSNRINILYFSATPCRRPTVLYGRQLGFRGYLFFRTVNLLLAFLDQWLYFVYFQSANRAFSGEEPDEISVCQESDLRNIAEFTNMKSF